jgi:hypothetical protein
MTVNIAEELVDIVGWEGAVEIIVTNYMMPELFLEKETRLQAKKKLSAMINKERPTQTFKT